MKNKNTDEQASGKAHGKPQYIDGGIEFIFREIAPGRLYEFLNMALMV